MSDDEEKLPRASLRGDKLYVAGEKEPYFRDLERWVSLEVTALRIIGDYELADLGERNSAKVPVRVSLRGIARFKDEDRFAVAGLETARDTPITFGLSAVPEEETRFHWRANIGFARQDWMDDIEESFYVECYCTSRPFEDVLAAVRTGRVNSLQLRMSTSMWTRDQSGFVDKPTTWHLAAPVDREPSRMPSYEVGVVEQLTWEERCGDHSVKPAADLPQTPSPVTLPKELYTILSVLAVIGVAIAVLLLWRR